MRTLAFVPVARGAEAVAADERGGCSRRSTRRWAAGSPPTAAGYLPEERRALEAALRAGRLLGLAATNALELGVDISGLDAVLIAGWPGTRASLWQQAGRPAGRGGTRWPCSSPATTRWTPTWCTTRRRCSAGRSRRRSSTPTTRTCSAPHLCAAAAELPLTEADLALFGPARRPSARRAGRARRCCAAGRPAGSGPARERAADLADLRGTGGGPVRIVEQATGRVLGTVDDGAADRTVHARRGLRAPGRDASLVDALDLDDAVALVEPRRRPDWTTHGARGRPTSGVARRRAAGRGATRRLSLGAVEVTSQVVAFLRRRCAPGEVLGEEPLDLPARTLRTKAVWWTVPATARRAAVSRRPTCPGPLHAAEHAADRAAAAGGDLRPLGRRRRLDRAAPRHRDAHASFVHDGHPGGAGSPSAATRAAARGCRRPGTRIADCECPAGCPSCVQSPKCGNGNEPLDKAAAAAVLDALLAGAP